MVPIDPQFKTLYVHRPLLNGQEFRDWAIAQGFTEVLDANDFHVTLAFSRALVDWNDIAPSKGTYHVYSDQREIVKMGPAIAMKFAIGWPNISYLEARWNQLKEAGCSWDYPGFVPHISITYKASDIDLTKIEPFKETLQFGDEVFEELDLKWRSKHSNRRKVPREDNHDAIG